MKILFCSTGFEKQIVGPAVFLNALWSRYNLRTESTNIELRILTEDAGILLDESIYSLRFNIIWPFNKLGMLARSWFYYRKIRSIAKEYQYTHVVFSDPVLAFFGIWSTQHSKKICFVNDDNNIHPWEQPSFKKKAVRFLYGILQRLTLAKADTIIVNSKYLGRQLGHIVGKDKLQLMYKGVDLEFFSFQPNHFKSDVKSVRVLFVKNDYIRGGLSDLLEALSSIEAIFFELCIAGVGKDVGGHLQEVLSYANIKVEVIPECTRIEIKNLMYKSDICCVPSRREALGVVNLEALAAGLPVVSTNIGGIPEATNYGKVAWLAEAKHPDDLKQQIINCICCEAERKKKVLEGRKWVEQHFDIDKTLYSFL
jgi:colanic acid/amylovoran biosynthesis glycosyltransferase